MVKALYFIGACLLSSNLLASKGTLDTTFGPNNNGLKLLDNATAVSSAIQYDESIYLLTSTNDDIEIHSIDLNGNVNSDFATNGILYISNDGNLANGTLRHSKLAVDGLGNLFIAHGDLRQVEGEYEAGIKVCQYQPSGILNPNFGNSGCYSWFWPYRDDAMSQGFPRVFAVNPLNNLLIVTGYINWSEVPQQRFELSIDLNAPFEQQTIQRFDTLGYQTTDSFIRTESSIFDSNVTDETLITDDVYSQEVRLTHFIEGQVNSDFGNAGTILIGEANIRINDTSYHVLSGIKPESADIKFSDSAIFTSHVNLNESNEYARSLIVKKFQLNGVLDDSFNSNGTIEIVLPDKDPIEVTSPDQILDSATTKMAILESGDLIVFAKLFYRNSQTLVAENKTQAYVISPTGDINTTSSADTEDLQDTFSSVLQLMQLNDGRLSGFGWRDTDQDNQSDSATFAVFNWENEVATNSSSGGAINIFVVLLLILSAQRKRL